MSNPEEIPEQDELPGMPEEDEYAPLIEWLEKTWGRDVKCPYCGFNEWVVGPAVNFAHGHSGQGRLFYTPEMFTVSCTNCGNTVLINREATEGFRSEEEGQ